jgi:hypothetical protein
MAENSALQKNWDYPQKLVAKCRKSLYYYCLAAILALRIILLTLGPYFFA